MKYEDLMVGIGQRCVSVKVAWQRHRSQIRLRNCKTIPPLHFCLLPADGGRNDYGSRLFSLIVEEIGTHGQLLA